MSLSLYDVEDLRRLPTLHQGHASDLKIDTGTTRVWLSRMGLADGETQPVQVERLVDGRWVDITKAEGQAGALNDVPLDGDFEGFRVRCLTRTFVEAR